MKWLVVLILPLAAQAASANTHDAIIAYSKTAYAKYGEALMDAQMLKSAIDQFIADPTEANLIVARSAWLTSRASYSPTEVYRLYGGPIDGENGPEGALNSWPLDEAYIDYVDGDANAGFIQHPDRLPTIAAGPLRDLNEKDGEKNIATGYHAIEFMLWGQDLYADSAGRRPATDYTTAPFADRRKAYLSVLADMIVADLQFVTDAWNPQNPNSYYQTFTNPAREQESLKNILTGVANLSGFELSQERMFTPLDNMSQEDEHSCFSDNTHNDFIYDVKGMANVLRGGIIDLVRETDEDVALELEEALAKAEKAMAAIPVPFDQAITENSPGRPFVMKGVESLEALSEATKQAAVVLGLEIPKPE
jgi:putative iron-regulated protein